MDLVTSGQVASMANKFLAFATDEFRRYAMGREEDG